MSIKLVNVSKRIERGTILSDISMKLETGSINLLIGANGSGKSTLLRLCAGLSKPSSGAIEGKVTYATTEWYNSLAYVGHDPMFYDELSLSENLHFFGKLSNCELQLEQLLEDWQLTNSRNLPFGKLSKGQKIRAAIARAFSKPCKLFLIDEPSNALDGLSIEILLKELVKRREQGACIFMATHDLHHFEGLADRVILLDEGHLCKDSLQDKQGLAKVISLYRETNR